MTHTRYINYIKDQDKQFLELSETDNEVDNKYKKFTTMGAVQGKSIFKKIPATIPIAFEHAKVDAINRIL